MVTLFNLLAKGYFPKELPPAFSSSKLADMLVNDVGGIQGLVRSHKTWTQLCAHSLARPGIIRRLLGVPNPLSFFNLAETIVNNHTDIERLINLSPYTQSRPVSLPKNSRALVPLAHDGSIPDTRAQRRCSAKYLLTADIVNFYPSIYTHSVPWAIEGKSVSKTRMRAKPKGLHTYADRLDETIRNCQYGQTTGIPVGPDTSLVLAELVLSSLDQQFELEGGAKAGLRYYDDYEFGYPTYSAAANGLAVLQQLLAEYQLLLNRDKTRIVELLHTLDKPWVNKIRAYRIHPTKDKLQRAHILAYFDAMVELSAEYPSDNIVEYAIGRLWRQVSDKTILDYNANLLQSLVMQIVLARPSSSIECYQLLLLLHQRGIRLDMVNIEATLNGVIESAAGLGYGSEVVWALWMALTLNLNINKAASSALSRSSDDFVVLLALDAENKGLIPDKLDKSSWLAYMDSNELEGNHWLVSYEANVKGWLPSSGGGDHVASHALFGRLKAEGVTFYSPVAHSPPAPLALIPPDPNRKSP